MRVELAVCQLLLGRRQEAEATLCLPPDSQQPPDPAVQDFVQVSTLHPPIILHAAKCPNRVSVMLL